MPLRLSQIESLPLSVAHVALPLLFAFFLLSCGDDDTGLAPILADGLPETCDTVTELFAVENIEGRTEHPCFDWLHRVYGRSARGGLGGSAAIWSINTGHKTALVTSACHVIRGFSEDQPGQPSVARFYNPTETTGFSFIRISDPAEYNAPDAASASFIFYHPYIPADVVSAAYSNILPENDFFLMLIDSQLLESVNGSIPMAEPIRYEPPDFYDPENLTLEEPTYDSIRAGELLLLIGYPTAESGRLYASVARVLSDRQAENAISELKKANDEEGFIPYNKDAEALVYGYAGIGMSGGGAFNREGRLVGIMVRMSLAPVETPIVRIVRMDHLVLNLHEAIENLSEEEYAQIAPFLDTALLPE